MSLEGLQERLVALQETTAQLRELIERLGNLKLEPGSVPLDAEEDSVSSELCAEIGQLLRGGLEEQEILQEEIKYLKTDGHEKSRLEDGVDRIAKELVSSRFAFRRARVAAKKTIEETRRIERQLLLKSYTVSEAASANLEHDVNEEPTRPERRLHKPQQYSSLTDEDRQTVGASNDVTTALRRTHDLIATELARSEFAHETLTESSAALKQLNESYGSLDTMLANSRDLLGTLLRSQKSDTWYLQTTLYMLFATAGWLAFRRFLYGPLWWLIYLPLRILFGLGQTAGGVVMQSRNSPSQSGSVDMGGFDNKAPVQGLPKEDTPVVQVGQPQAGGQEEGSHMEDIDRIVDAVREADELGSITHEPDYGADENERPGEKVRPEKIVEQPQAKQEL
ncbi:hypothetical protein S7711_08930 [Stachybotrys chartarum IBT 7711]|uniref:Sec20 C-terminal domain-containing protein n=1 Tax=Stachybotrys chartarum (strain CBS 109288 / IBT 7711) TaxID=1280523 RepID=A0A084AI02_STACB|nr:hypothetical protein S7711_08930 [Stachybotrys chartarum IBT 7711]